MVLGTGVKIQPLELRHAGPPFDPFDDIGKQVLPDR